MSDVSKQVLKEIRQRQLRPYPRWHFVFRRSVIWTIFFISILLGSISAGIVIFQIRHAEWDLYQYFTDNLSAFLLLIVPYFWLLFLIGFSLLAYSYFRRTERGYRFWAFWVVLGSIVLSIIGGSLIYSTGLPKHIESVFYNKVSFYRVLSEHKQKVWVSPDQGLLAGRIVTVISERSVLLEDLVGNEWTIDISDTIWRGNLVPREDLKIKIIGERGGENRFVAKEIRPGDRKKQQAKSRDLRGNKRSLD
ncbi:MAG: hypothetical protein JW882_03165 [Deltaproteobacteria bacterium]|nr:hypothetical protein [Deltaproteobacteria bacterium]